MLFSGQSFDLVISEELSPDLDVPQMKYGDSPEFLENKWCHKLGTSVELSLENGIDHHESEIKTTHKTPTVKFSTMCQTFEEEFSPEASFELAPPPPPPEMEEDSRNDLIPVSGNNVGCNGTGFGGDGPQIAEFPSPMVKPLF